jgi:hypothetical protein
MKLVGGRYDQAIIESELDFVEGFVGPHASVQYLIGLFLLIAGHAFRRITTRQQSFRLLRFICHSLLLSPISKLARERQSRYRSTIQG